MSLLSAMSLECDYGVPVPLMRAGYRRITAAENLAGLSVRSKVLPRGGQHGSTIRTRHRTDQQPVITGLCLDEYTNDPDRAWQEYYAMSRAFGCAVDTDRLLRWTAGGLDLQQFVRVEEVKAPVEYGPALIRYQVAFRAGDPRAYSQTESTVFVAVLGT